MENLPSTLVCGTQCAPLSWDFVGSQFYMAAGLWAAFTSLGIIGIICSATTNLDNTKERSGLVYARLHASLVYNLLFLGCAFLQCGLFCLRAYRKSVSDLAFFVEVSACSVYFIDFFVTWIHKHLIGPTAGLRFMCTRAIPICVLIPSVVGMTLLQVNGAKSWSSLSFFATFHLIDGWQRLLSILHIDVRVLRWQVTDSVITTCLLVFFAASMMMTLENLGDPEILKTLNADKWNTISSVYYVVATISTVGYGDLAPTTGLGRIFAVVAIFGGITMLLLTLNKVVQVISINTHSGGTFEPGLRTRHIVITGSPTSQMVKDFMAELFHPDHADDAEDLHAVFVFPSGTGTMSVISQFLLHKSNIRIAARVHLIKGSVLDRGVLGRASGMQAIAFFVLPNVLCVDPMQEDTENIIRMMGVQNFIPDVRVILVLMKSEHQQLLQNASAASTGDSNVTCFAMDQFKLELVGKTCQVPGFITFICNLCKSINCDAEDGKESTKPVWVQEYEYGIGHELYEVELSAAYAARQALFCEVVIDVLEQTGGAVYLIGLVETRQDGKHVLVNPGPFYPIKQASGGILIAGIFIAPDREAVVQCEGGMVFLGRRERPVGNSEGVVTGDPNNVNQVITQAQQDKVNEERKRKESELKASLMGPEEGTVDPRLLSYLTPKQQEHARQLVGLVKQHHRSSQPSRPPLKLLAKGGHILFLCVGANSSTQRFGLEHFVRPLRQQMSSHKLVPIVVIAPFAPQDWHRVADYPEIHFLPGSPMSIFDLDRANFRSAEAIFVCHVAASSNPGKYQEAWMVDAEVICCTRLVEGQLPPGSQTVVVADLNVDSNYPFVPLPGSSLPGGRGPDPGSPTFAHRKKDLPKRSYTNVGTRLKRSVTTGSASTVQTQRASALLRDSDHPEFYKNPRFACGQLFVGTVVTSLAVNTFYNPSLCQLVSTMITAQIAMIEVPKDWVGKSYFELFDHLMWNEHFLGIGIFRTSGAGAGAGGALVRASTGGLVAEAPPPGVGGEPKKLRYLYTAPPAKETTMLATDRVICFRAPRRPVA